MSGRKRSTRSKNKPPPKPVAENICTVVANDWVNDLYKHLILEAPATALTAQPGQFFHLLCPAADGETPATRPIAFSAIAEAPIVFER